MDREAAVQQLQSSAPHDRLKAVRYFNKHATSQDLPALTKAFQDETVSWVRKALSAAIEKLATDKPVVPLPVAVVHDVPEATVRQIHAKAVEEVSGTILHEFQGIIGVLKLRAIEEIPNYEASGVKVQLDRLEGLVTAIEGLKKAAAVPKHREFDLAALVRDIADEESADKDIGVSLVGPSPMFVQADPDLLRLAICNGLRNAIDAVSTLPPNARNHAVIVNWGATDIETWLAIIDRGPGLRGGVQGAFNIGTTTKKGHSGMGLPIARQAVQSMEGDILLTPGKERGVQFEIRWYR